MNYKYEFRKQERQGVYGGRWNLPNMFGTGVLGKNCNEVVKSVLEELAKNSISELELASPTISFSNMCFGWTRISDDELEQIYGELSKKRPYINFVITHDDTFSHVIRF